MRVLMISPHLPPEQAANALLPVVLAGELAQYGVGTRFVAHPPSDGQARRTLAHVTYVPRRGRSRFARTPAGAVLATGRMAAGTLIPALGADLVHLHSNGLIVEVGGVVATALGVPRVITLYGTDVWHHDPNRHRRFGRVVGGGGRPGGERRGRRCWSPPEASDWRPTRRR
jgi:hypothetical protein